jgi:hypothetical protein
MTPSIYGELEAGVAVTGDDVAGMELVPGGVHGRDISSLISASSGQVSSSREGCR